MAESVKCLWYKLENLVQIPNTLIKARHGTVHVYSWGVG